MEPTSLKSARASEVPTYPDQPLLQNHNTTFNSIQTSILSCAGYRQSQLAGEYVGTIPGAHYITVLQFSHTVEPTLYCTDMPSFQTQFRRPIEFRRLQYTFRFIIILVLLSGIICKPNLTSVIPYYNLRTKPAQIFPEDFQVFFLGGLTILGLQS